MLTAQKIYDTSLPNRKQLIVNATPSYNSINNELEKVSALSKTINLFIADYFSLKIRKDKEHKTGSILAPNNLDQAIDAEISKFKREVKDELRKIKLSPDEFIASSQNLYEMSGAARLASANKISRHLSTTMGLLWERLAAISPYAINPEMEFNLKIKGIDLIAKNFITQRIEHIQLKTQKNTLTGSQQSRSVAELLLHENPVFCACFNNKSTWTFSPHEKIPRVAGEEFWERIGIPYETIFRKAKSLVLELEKAYIS